jgi:hypothetical protein
MVRRNSSKTQTTKKNIPNKTQQTLTFVCEEMRIKEQPQGKEISI